MEEKTSISVDRNEQQEQHNHQTLASKQTPNRVIIDYQGPVTSTTSHLGLGWLSNGQKDWRVIYLHIVFIIVEIC